MADPGRGGLGVTGDAVASSAPVELFLQRRDPFHRGFLALIEAVLFVSLRNGVRDPGGFLGFLAEEADFGAAFDGDADRVFVVDEKGVTISGDLLATLVAKNVLEKEPGAAIIYSAVCSKALPELVRIGSRPRNDVESIQNICHLDIRNSPVGIH